MCILLKNKIITEIPVFDMDHSPERLMKRLRAAGLLPARPLLRLFGDIDGSSSQDDEDGGGLFDGTTTAVPFFDGWTRRVFGFFGLLILITIFIGFFLIIII
jgi:hypothetical protein